MDLIQKLQNVLNYRRVNISEKLESSIRDLARTGDIQSCKTARKAGDAALKESAKDLKALHDALLSSARSLNILPKVQSLLLGFYVL
jgi:oligosaccharyltransferase complex subunit alpha (ribophorin I)